MDIRWRRFSDDSAGGVVMVLSGAYRAVSGKGWSSHHATHGMPCNKGGERKTTFIRRVLLSLVAHVIRATVVRSSEIDLMAEIDRACLFDWVKRRPLDWWGEIDSAGTWRYVFSRNVWRVRTAER